MAYRKYCFSGDHYICLVNTDFTDESLYVSEIGMRKYGLSPPGNAFLHKSYYLHYMAEGKAYSNNQLVKKGFGFLVCPNQLHIFDPCKEDMPEHYWIRFDGTKAKTLLSSFGIQSNNHIFSFDWEDKIFPLLESTLNDDPKQRNNASFMLGVLHILLSYHKKDAEFEKPALIQKDYIDNAVYFIDINYQYPITILDIAKHVNISQKYLYRIFCKEFGISPKEFIIKKRITKAEEYLLKTSMKISEISLSVGYDDPVYFSKLFRKYKLTTPTKFRKDYLSSLDREKRLSAQKNQE